MTSKTAARRGRRMAPAGNPLRAVKPVRDVCLELQDYSVATQSAVKLFDCANSADPASQAARLTEQFLIQNRPVLQTMQVEIGRDYDGKDLHLVIRSNSAIGAVPLISPTTARPDFGLVIQPRFPWAGIGPMLAEMGWLIPPTPLKLPLLKRSERRVPPWVLSFMILARFQALLDRLDRRFEMVSEVTRAPKGSVNWTSYATLYAARGDFLSLPCTFPDLRDDRQLKGALRFAIERQLRSLETQREQGSFVHRLIAVAESLLVRVLMVPARRPGGYEVEGWLRRPLRSDAFTNGLQAIEWTVEDRGLAGVSDLEGVPWMLPMEQFFEAWVETVMRQVALQTGARLRAGRKRETITQMSWEPSYLGSQRSLVPDLMLEFEESTIIVDAKYKRHWEELQSGDWAGRSEVFKEEHRADLLQVLAYANLANTSTIICCLVYPCSRSTWESLAARGRLFHRAELPDRGRNVQVWLTAVPMHAATKAVAEPFIRRLRCSDWTASDRSESPESE